MIPKADQVRIAREGTLEERWSLAGSGEIDADAAAALASEEEEHAVLSSLAANDAVPESVLARLAQAHPELRPLVSGNVHAPIELKEQYPINVHTERSLAHYLDSKSATTDQRVRFRAKYLEVVERRADEVTLGEVWRWVDTD